MIREELLQRNSFRTLYVEVYLLLTETTNRDYTGFRTLYVEVYLH